MSIQLTPPAPITAEVLRRHLGVLIDDPDGVSARRDRTQSLWRSRPLMLRQGDHLVPLAQAGVCEGHIFVETWASFEHRLLAGDNQ